MLQKNTKISKESLLVLLTWLKGDNMLHDKPFEFDYLFSECVENDNEEDIDIKNIIDQIMIDLFSVYVNLSKSSIEEIEEKLKKNVMFNILSKDIVSESMRSVTIFLDLYEKLLMNTKFEYPEIRGIQKNIMTTLLNQHIEKEEFEICIELQEKLKNI